MFREMTEKQKAVVIAVTNQYINMLYNNVINDNGVESFIGWCEDGDVFEGSHIDNWDECIALMEEVAPLIDKLTYKFLNLGH